MDTKDARAALYAHYQQCGIPKPEPRKKADDRFQRRRAKDVTEIRVYVFARDRNLCRCCRLRPAESMHELRFRSLGGKVSKKNSIAVCGDGTRSCHGHLQGNRIAYEFESDYGAEGTIFFTPTDRQSAEWLRINVGERIESAPMVQMEAAE